MGVGPVLDFPSGGSLRGSQKWSAGVSGVLLTQTGNWTLGCLANNVWSYAGNEDRDDVNKGLLQYFVVYQLGDGCCGGSTEQPSVARRKTGKR